MEIHIKDAEPSVAGIIEAKLLESLRSSLVQAENESFVLTASSSSDPLIGGLTASTSYGWLLTKVLWVAEQYRHQGVGNRLMRAAEAKGIGFGCHSAWLETSNPEARQFYEALGYTVFGKLSNAANRFPEAHQRWFLRKDLDTQPDTRAAD